MNLDRIDLNLIRVLDVILEERNLARAGLRLHLSQSAVSHALARMREAIGDELFVRTGKGLEPTARALAMAPLLREALTRIKQSLGVQPFDPQRSTRRFTIAANDHITAVFVARLSRRLGTGAPGITLVVQPSTRLDLAEQLDVGCIDLAIGLFAEVPGRLRCHSLATLKEVVVMPKGHPGARRRFTLEDLARYPLLAVSVGGDDEGAVGGFIVERGLARQSEMFDRRSLEEALKDAGLAPNIRVTVPHSPAIPSLLIDSDMLSIVPETLAQEFAASSRILVRQLPYDAPGTVLRAVWHRRNDHDAACLWLLGEVRAVAQAYAS
ncbi:LysR family transcriptional regulator [Azohydromonas aeria]|uniref:LysR family transcriptional regulator n=1 Tax=Azohydromonas aeria TaxID=2590212 RepID=UPI0012F886AC|nr:LysR family transcriptional regulator [Azohydromonas aeria]